MLEMADRVLAACPDVEWRLIFAPSRFGGLPPLRGRGVMSWCDVDWEGGRFIVHSPKTEHHEGGESRVVPIFPELRQYLEEAWELAPEGAEFGGDSLPRAWSQSADHV